MKGYLSVTSFPYTDQAMEIVIISGLSGSGKSIALRALEDLDYYCIDNLPAVLLPQVGQELLAQAQPDMKKAAVSIDSRNRDFLQTLPENLDALRTLGLPYKVIFLEADPTILLKRYKETRRKHPLTDETTSLTEGIELEKKLLSPLSDNADMRIDTTYRTPHDLRALMRAVVGVKEEGRILVLFESFGYKHSTPLDADFVFDVRCLPNPYWKPDLRPLSGKDEPVKEFLESHDIVGDMVTHIGDFLAHWLPSFKRENRSYITVAIGCTGGQHRSVYTVERLAKRFTIEEVDVQIRHRELSKMK